MIVFPNAKINLGLNILRKRDDGFHDIETLFYPIQLTDAVEIIQVDESNTIEFTQTGLQIDGKEEDNLCSKAYSLLKTDFPQLPGIKMHLHKVIPMGGGLGGGSSDASAVLKMLNEKFNLKLSNQQLLNYALQLGSDCPFFIINNPCLASDRGENMVSVSLDLSAYSIAVINPGIHINTKWAFSKIFPVIPKKSIPVIILQDIDTWKDDLKNDFEQPVFEKYPAIKEVKEGLYSQGALYASMSGSGSTVYGIFKNEIQQPLFPHSNYFERII